MYPNPANDIVYLNVPNLKGTATVSINSIDGSIVASTAFSETKAQLSINKLPNGVYFIKIKTHEGIAVRKLVKQ